MIRAALVLLGALLLALPAAADTGLTHLLTGHGIRIDGTALSAAAWVPAPDTTQLVALDLYLNWRGVVPEASKPWLNAAGMRRLYYLIDGARRPGILKAGIDVIRVEIIQFPTEEAAAEFDPLTQTDLGVYRTDLHGPGELERHILYRTRTVRNGNLVLFIDLGGETPLPEDVASVRRVCDRLIAAFTDDEWQWRDLTSVANAEKQHLREWQQALLRLQDCGLPLPVDEADVPRRERDELRGELQRTLEHCRRLVPQLEASLDALNADEPWRVPVAVTGLDAVRLLAARADSDVYLADRRTIEFAAIDALFAVTPEALPESGPELPAITAMLRESEENGLLEEQCRLLGLYWPLRIEGLRTFGKLGGVTVRASEEEDRQAAAGTRPWRWGGSRDSRMPTLSPGWGLALYLRKTDAGWVIRKGVARHEVPWQGNQ